MPLFNCLGSLVIIVVIWGNTVQASTASCRLQGDPHFLGFTTPMRGPAPYPCDFWMLSTAHFNMLGGDDAVVNINARSNMVTNNGRYFIDYVFFQMETIIGGAKKHIEYEIQAAISDPWIVVTNTAPAGYSSKVVASYVSSTTTASIDVYDNSGTRVLLVEFVHQGKKLIVTVDPSVQPPLSALFHQTLCSTFTDTTWGGVVTTDLTNQQIILFGLLNQNIAQTDDDCITAVSVFQSTCTDANEQREALKECDHFLNTVEAKCLENADDGYLGGDAFKAFYLCINAQPGCGNVVHSFYTTLLARNCH